MKKITVRQMALVGIMAAMVYVTSAYIQIPIPTAIGNTRLHVGNVMCLLSGLLLGPVLGGLAAGFGSMLFDLLNPAYITSAPFTFIFKFLMAWVCAKIAFSGNRQAKNHGWNIAACVIGALTYVALYMLKTFIYQRFIYGYPVDAVFITMGSKLPASLLNAVAAMVAAPILYSALRPALERAGQLRKMRG